MGQTDAALPALIESADVARLLGCTPGYVRILARLGQITPRFVTPRGVRLYDVDDVLRVADERRHREAAEVR